ncbi:uncharacterized protein LOC134753760 [Cydia strobilella]|uniref:uncharacterized protein LOC134753760 n=1 Tax=Cydia strobilella TaxID=1100964 RepID=UPI003006E09A
MLRWAGGVTLLDRIRNTYIRGSFKVRPLPEKITKGRLRWFGHVMRREPEHMTRKVLDMFPTQSRRGRPRLTWLAKVKRDMEEAQIPPEMTQDREAWRNITRRADPK